MGQKEASVGNGELRSEGLVAHFSRADGVRIRIPIPLSSYSFSEVPSYRWSSPAPARSIFNGPPGLEHCPMSQDLGTIA
jgi:hypothetical protein